MAAAAIRSKRYSSILSSMGAAAAPAAAMGGSAPAAELVGSADIQRISSFQSRSSITTRL